MARISRRGFVGAGAAAAAFAQPGGWRTFTPEEAAVVEALCDAIVPADDQPGAKAAGAVRYIDRQLAGPLRRFLPAYRKGIPAFNAACAQAAGKPFLELSAEARTQYLERMGRSGFFDMVIDHTMQGFYGSPAHGGNAGGASWKMLDIEQVMGEHHPGEHRQ